MINGLKLTLYCSNTGNNISQFIVTPKQGRFKTVLKLCKYVYRKVSTVSAIVLELLTFQ